MAEIKYIALKGNDWLAKVIKYQTQSEYSHIAYLIPAEQAGPEYAIECWPENIWKIFKVKWAIRPFLKGYPKGSEYEIWKLKVSEAQQVFIHNFMQGLANKGAYFDYVAAFGLFTKWRKEKEGQYFCSEGCVAPLVKVFGWSHIKPWLVTPEIFICIIQAAGGKLIKKEIVK